MLQTLIVCSGCGEEAEVIVEDLDALDREACPCGYSYVLLSVAEFEPIYARRGEVIELPAGKKLKLVA